MGTFLTHLIEAHEASDQTKKYVESMDALFEGPDPDRDEAAWALWMAQRAWETERRRNAEREASLALLTEVATR